MNHLFHSSFALLLLVFSHICIVQGDWGDFQRKHILDPALDTNHERFSQVEWKDWMSKHYEQLEVRDLNVILIGSNATILNLFRGGRDRPLVPIHPESPESSQYWSLTKFPMYALRPHRLNMSNPEDISYEVFNCKSDFWIGAVIDLLYKPMRMLGFSESQGSPPQFDTSRCTLIRNSAVSIKITALSLSFAIFVTLWTFVTSY